MNINTQVNYLTCKLSDMVIEKNENEYSLIVNNFRYKIQEKGRFFHSLNLKLGINQSFFKLFDPVEVFERVIKKSKDVTLRIAIEDKTKVLAVSYQDNNILSFEEAKDFLIRKNASRIAYSNGIIEGTFDNEENNPVFNIGSDEFKHNKVLRIPIDGFGQTHFYVSLYRLVCANGMGGYANAFATPVNLDHKNPLNTLNRATDNFKNSEGYKLLEEKMRDSQSAVLSLKEALFVRKMLNQKLSRIVKPDGTSLLNEYVKMTNMDYYGIKDTINLGEMARALPCRSRSGDFVRVYDVLNFLTEISSHHASDSDKSHIDKLVGTILSNEFDIPELDNVKNKEFQDLFLEGDYHEAE